MATPNYCSCGAVKSGSHSRCHACRVAAGRSKVDPRLTLREESILKLTAIGLVINAIADELKVSPKTVEHHRQNAYKKLGIHWAGDVVHYAISKGLVTAKQF